MVETRSRKRSGTGEDDDVASAAAETTDPEEALAAASQVRARKAKERRIEAHRKKPQFEVLCDQGVIPIVFAMFDNSRDVFNLAFTSKYVLSFVTAEVVVRSAVFQGAHPRKAIGAIIEAVKERSIYVPSPLRLLRLVNGKVCERLEECWGYDLVRKAPVSLARSSQRPFGLMLCKRCLSGSTISLPYNHFAADEARASTDWKVLNTPYIDPTTGERHGPFVLAKHVKQIESSYKTEDDRKAALRKVLERADADMPDDAESCAQALVEIHTEAESQADSFFEAKNRIQDEKRRAKADQRAAKRFERKTDLFGKLEAMLEGYPHKDIALACIWYRDWGDVHFKCTLSRIALNPLFNASSSATQKKIKAAAEEIRRVYDLLASKNFLSAGFLSFLQKSSNHMERALYQWCLSENLTPTKLLEKGMAGSDWLDLVRTDEPVVSLVRLLSFEDFAASFAIAVATTNENRSNLCKLAKCVWKKVWHDLGYGRSKESKWSEAQPIATVTYRRLRDACVEYMARPSTIEFADDTSPSNVPIQAFSISRRNAVDTVYVDSRSHSKLLARDFEGLLALHQGYFRNPARVAHLRFYM